MLNNNRDSNNQLNSSSKLNKLTKNRNNSITKELKHESRTDQQTMHTPDLEEHEQCREQTAKIPSLSQVNTL